jgi:hypothetical protein
MKMALMIIVEVKLNMIEAVGSRELRESGRSVFVLLNIERKALFK